MVAVVIYSQGFIDDKLCNSSELEIYYDNNFISNFQFYFKGDVHTSVTNTTKKHDVYTTAFEFITNMMHIILSYFSYYWFVRLSFTLH
jgi:hypothetical protein